MPGGSGTGWKFDKLSANYGASTTPTLVLIDAGGTLRLYHPGQMKYEELKARIRAIAGPIIAGTSAPVPSSP